MLDSVIEPQREVPLVFGADVAVAGGGVSGVFAALAAAKHGARTIIIDRFGDLGGNIGPGMCTVGSMLLSHGKIKDGVPMEWVKGGVAGIPREFAERFQELGGGGGSRRTHHLRDHHVASYLASQMLKERGVEIMVSTFVADPMMEGKTVKGVFIENKSGRGAVGAKIVIDATGEADLVRRAGGSIIVPREEYHELDGHAPSGVGFWCFAAGVEWKRYDDFVAASPETGEGDSEWSREHMTWVYPSHLLPLLMRSWEGGGYRALADIGGIAKVRSWTPKIRIEEEGLAGFKIQLDRPHGEVDVSDGSHISMLEDGMRRFCYETVEFWRENVPGFEKCYLVAVSPFLGNRGGPCIRGEYTLTAEDCRQGRRFDDVVYVYGESRALRYTCKELGECLWTDVPYRVMVPKDLDGVIAVGRSASCIPDTLLRNRVGVMHMGEAGGTAAAIASRSGVHPRDIDVKQLQRALLDGGYHLGDDARLSELGLL